MYKQKNGKMRAIANGSRTLPPAEKNYNLQSGKLEFLDLKQAICEKHGYYLFYVSCFTVYPNNNPLTWVLQSLMLLEIDGVGELEDLRFSVK